MSKEANSNDIQVLDVLLVLAKHKMLVIKMVVVITLISLAISLVWPKTYRSGALVLPPAQQQGLSGLAGMLGGALPLSLGTAPQVSPEIILSILNSRTLRVELIEEFDLREVYRSDIMEELLIKLAEAIKIQENREGGFGFNPIISIHLSVTDREPERARDMAQFLVNRLEETINTINRNNAIEQFEMIRERYERNLVDMEKAEQAFLAYQQTHGIIEVEEQAKVVIGTLAEIKARTIETEMAINVLRQSVSDNHPELRRLERTRDELNHQYDRFFRKTEQQARTAQVAPPLLDIPDLALNYYRLYRDVTVQNKIYELIYPQYDFQKLITEFEKRGVQIIDKPHLPTYKDAPKRAFIVLGGMVFSIFLSFLIVFYRHTMETGEKMNTLRYKQIRELQQHFRFRKKTRSSNEE